MWILLEMQSTIYSQKRSNSGIYLLDLRFELIQWIRYYGNANYYYGGKL